LPPKIRTRLGYALALTASGSSRVNQGAKMSIDADVFARIRRAIELDPSASHAWDSSEAVVIRLASLKPPVAVRNGAAEIVDAVGWLPLPGEPAFSALAAELMLLPRLAATAEALGRLGAVIESGEVNAPIGLRRAAHGLNKAIRGVAEANGWAGHLGAGFVGRLADRLEGELGPGSDLILSLAAAWRADLDLAHHSRGDRLADLAQERGVGPVPGVEPARALAMLESEYERRRKLPAFGPSWPKVPTGLADEIEGHRRAIDGVFESWASEILAKARIVSPEEYRARTAVPLEAPAEVQPAAADPSRSWPFRDWTPTSKRHLLRCLGYRGRNLSKLEELARKGAISTRPLADRRGHDTIEARVIRPEIAFKTQPPG
jgi:hypothetical protein